MPRPSSISSSPSANPGLPAAGTVQGEKRHAHRGDRLGRRAGLGGDLGQVAPRLGGGAGDLVDQDRPGQPAPAGVVAPAAAGQGHVVGHDHDLDRQSLGPRQLGGEAEVQPVAGVVLDDQERPGAARRRPGSRRARRRAAGEVKTSPATAALSIPRPT